MITMVMQALATVNVLKAQDKNCMETQHDQCLNFQNNEHNADAGLAAATGRQESLIKNCMGAQYNNI